MNERVDLDVDLEGYTPPAPKKEYVGNGFSIEELHRHTDTLVRRAIGGDVIEIVRDGEVVAKIVPGIPKEERIRRIKKIFSEMDEIAKRVSEKWDDPSMTAVDAVREQRRDL